MVPQFDKACGEQMCNVDTGVHQWVSHIMWYRVLYCYQFVVSRKLIDSVLNSRVNFLVVFVVRNIGIIGI